MANNTCHYRQRHTRTFVVCATAAIALISVFDLSAAVDGEETAPIDPKTAAQDPAAATGQRTPATAISSTGPLDEIHLGDDVSTQVEHTEDTSYEVYPPGTIPGDYGTFLVISDQLYAPNFSGHGGTATGSLGSYTALSPVGQSAVGGSGTNIDPYKVITEADVGTTGLRIRETTSYVEGQESYRTDVTVRNLGSTPRTVLLYRALDCYLAGSDHGYGMQEGTVIGCSVNPNNDPADRIEQLVPLHAGSHYYEALYSDVWAAIGTHQPFDDTCRCDDLIDNGAGLSWEFSLPGGGEVTRSHLTVFSPEGFAALLTTKTVSNNIATLGQQVTYRIAITNPNSADVVLNSITDTLPVGFSYIAGTTDGVTSAEPSTVGLDLIWTGPFTAPATSSTSLSFDVTVASVTGTYFNLATADAGDVTVADTGPTAPVAVYDCLIQLAELSFEASENDGVAEITVQRTGISNEASVRFATADGTAVAGSDYSAIDQTLHWDVGQGTDVTVQIPVMSDLFVEGSETVAITISEPTGVCGLGAPSDASLNITDPFWRETRINVTSLNQQTRSSIGMDAAGNIVVSWDAFDQDGDDWGVFGRLLDNMSDPITGEFQINQETAGDQRDNAVAMLPDGRFAVAWEGQDVSGTEIFLRTFSADGTALSGEVLVNTVTSANQTDPAVAALADGTLMVVWESAGQDGDGLGVFGRIMSVTGSALSAEVAVNQETAGDQHAPEVSHTDDGFVVVWQTINQDGPATGIFARRFSRTGVATEGEWIVNTITSGNQKMPDVVGSASDAMTIVWHDVNHLDGDGASVRCQPFNEAGQPASNEQRINTYFLNDQSNARVCMRPDGGALVVWESTDQDGAGDGVFGQMLDPAGYPFGGEFRANTWTINSQHQPNVACTESGRFAITWTSGFQDGSGDGVYVVISTLTSADVLFTDGFESGDTTHWH